MEGRPTASPRNLQVTAFNSTTLEVTWEPPDAQFINGRNRGYKVHARIVGSTEPEMEFIVDPFAISPTGSQRTFLYE